MTFTVRVAHTADVGSGYLAASRALLYAVFDDMTEPDWEHCLGGMHAIAIDGEGVVGHASVIQRRIIHSGRALRAGYVEGVAVRADYRRRGCASALMVELERVIAAAYDLGALGTTDEAVPFYTGRGWRQWTGPTYGLTPDGRRRTADDDGAVYVLGVDVPLDLDGDITADWRDGDVW